MIVLTGPNVILLLKILVTAVTVLLLTSLVVLALGKVWLHGRINVVFFILTVATLLGFELLIQVVKPELFRYFLDEPTLRRRLQIHLCFSIPSALLLPVMLYTGLTHKRKVHLTLALIFGLLWVGTFVTGVIFLPHSE